MKRKKYSFLKKSLGEFSLNSYQGESYNTMLPVALRIAWTVSPNLLILN